MVDRVEDVLLGDAVLARRVMNLHTLIVIRKGVGTVPSKNRPIARGRLATNRVPNRVPNSAFLDAAQSIPEHLDDPKSLEMHLVLAFAMQKVEGSSPFIRLPAVHRSLAPPRHASRELRELLALSCRNPEGQAGDGTPVCREPGRRVADAARRARVCLLIAQASFECPGAPSAAHHLLGIENDGYPLTWRGAAIRD
jgi:hypothetical protein